MSEATTSTAFKFLEKTNHTVRRNGREVQETKYRVIPAQEQELFNSLGLAERYREKRAYVIQGNKYSFYSKTELKQKFGNRGEYLPKGAKAKITKQYVQNPSNVGSRIGKTLMEEYRDPENGIAKILRDGRLNLLEIKVGDYGVRLTKSEITEGDGDKENDINIAQAKAINGYLRLKFTGKNLQKIKRYLGIKKKALTQQ